MLPVNGEHLVESLDHPWRGDKINFAGSKATETSCTPEGLLFGFNEGDWYLTICLYLQISCRGGSYTPHPSTLVAPSNQCFREEISGFIESHSSSVYVRNYAWLCGDFSDAPFRSFDCILKVKLTTLFLFLCVTVR